ncbi:MAG: SGNH/GDSL hydrolase family protein, partial [Cyanobacteria bacterium P01_A01_bin.135]
MKSSLLTAVCLPLALLGCGTSNAAPDSPAPPTAVQESPAPVSGPTSGPTSGPILAIGDSIFKWNAETDSAIPDVIGQALNRPVTNSAVSGAHLSLPEGNGSGPEYDIRQQYQPQAWDWVVMNGGANDLAGSCACTDCSDLLNTMISEDGLSGEIPEFVRQVTATGSRLLYVGYYDMPSDARFGFDQCNDELETQNARLVRMAEALPNVWFVSAGAVVTPQDKAAYDADLVHPSPIGSA